MYVDMVLWLGEKNIHESFINCFENMYILYIIHSSSETSDSSSTEDDKDSKPAFLTDTQSVGTRRSKGSRVTIKSPTAERKSV